MTEVKSYRSAYLASLVVLLLLGAAAALGHLNFARWDNTETFLPAIWYAHSQILRGHFPLWNPLQNLGEPLHALGIGGALYPPYTIAVGLVKLLRWPEAATLDVIAVAHAAFGAFGLALLLIELRVRASCAFVAAVSAMLSGFAMTVGSMWVHVLPNLAWSAWAMWGLRRVVAGEGARKGAPVAAVSLAIVFFTGHVQSGVNVWLAVWLWTAAIAIACSMTLQRARVLFLIAMSGALMSLPAVLPTALIVSQGDRLAAEHMSPGLGFSPLSLHGMLIPTIRHSDGALVHVVMITTFVGAWVVPALVLGGGALLHYRKRVDALHARIFLATALAAGVFIWLNFGPPAGLYRALHALPIFDHFRMPFKYWERAVPLLAIAGALGLELSVALTPRRWQSLVILLLCAGAAFAWAMRPADEPLAWLAGGTALVVLLAMVVLPQRSAILALVPLTIVQAIGIIAIAHSTNRSKPYLTDRRTDARLPITDTRYRVLPLSAGPPDTPFMRPLSLFYAASLDGYASASGHRFALTSRRLTENIHADVTRRPFRGQQFAELLSGNWLRLANVGYLIVEIGDTSAANSVLRAHPDARLTSTSHAWIYLIDPRWPRAYFATEQVPGNAAGTFEVLFTNIAPVSAAAVEGDDRRRPLPTGVVSDLAWGVDRIAARVIAPIGGLLVFSTSYSTEWDATIDGARHEVVPVNGMFAGVWVPANAHEVVLRIRRWPLYLGFLGALLGASLCWVLFRVRENGSSPRRHRDTETP